jgi:hypothetical protein
MDRIERIDSPRPHERTWAVTPLRDREQQREREQQRRKPPQPPAESPRDDDEPPHLVDVQA